MNVDDLTKIVNELDVEKAKCLMPADKEMILANIK
jgi:hypothetical protein